MYILNGRKGFEAQAIAVSTQSPFHAVWGEEIWVWLIYIKGLTTVIYMVMTVRNTVL